MRYSQIHSTILPLVSVTIITYNHEKFINSAIESVLWQDYPNFRIVISDDASTDNTVKIIKKYIENYPNKIKLLLSKKNIGASHNWFKSISICTGKYAIGLAGDDEFFPGIISRQVNIMESDSDIAMCYSDAVVFHVPTNKTLYYLSNKTPTKSGGIRTALSDAIYYSPSTMFRKKFVPQENSFINIKHGTDLAFYKEIMILAGPNSKLFFLPEVLYKYQKHGSNITVTQTEYRREHIEAIKILQNKYPKYAKDLAPSIYDFCCVGFFKSLKALRLHDANFYFYEGLKAAKGNPFKFLRAITWAINFIINKKSFSPKYMN